MAFGVLTWQATHQSTGKTVSSSSTTNSSTPSSGDPTAYWNAVQAYWQAWLAAHPLTPPHQTPPTATSAGRSGWDTRTPSTLEPSGPTGSGGPQKQTSSGETDSSSDVSGGITSIGEGLIQQLKDKGITFQDEF